MDNYVCPLHILQPFNPTCAVDLHGAKKVQEQLLRAILATVAEGRATGPGYVFNLGHGVLPETDPTVLTRIVELVHGAGTP